jgi:excisionase family DNA binding protein
MKTNAHSDAQQPQISRVFVTKKELARILSVSVRTIEGWVLSGKIPVHKFSPRCVRFKLSLVMDLLAALEIQQINLKRSRTSNTLISAQKNASSSEEA